jgi:hypothetical protein
MITNVVLHNGNYSLDSSKKKTICPYFFFFLAIVGTRVAI